MTRIIIIGNSGSGKTHLAKIISKKLSIANYSLDDIFWEPGGFNQKRAKTDVESDINSIRNRNDWIVEGVFGELAAQFIDKASVLIWLDLDWNQCKRNLLQRGPNWSNHHDPTKAQGDFDKLIDWASQYWERENLRSFTGHKQIFDGFDMRKFKLSNLKDIETFSSQAQEISSK